MKLNDKRINHIIDKLQKGSKLKDWDGISNVHGVVLEKELMKFLKNKR